MKLSYFGSVQMLDVRLQMTDQWMIMFLGRIDDRELHEKISKQFVIDVNSYKSSQMMFGINCKVCKLSSFLKYESL